MNERILVVEDDFGLSSILGDRLRSEGYAVSLAADGPEGLAHATREQVDLMILDVMLPGESGLEVCRELRRLGFSAPILMLTARRQTIDRVVGLKTGADDYLTKPFSMDELLARIEALLRRAARRPGAGGFVSEFNGIRIDSRRTEVTRGGVSVPLSAKEFQLLQYFAEHQGETLSREELLREVWGYGSTPSTRTVDVHVAWLRQKLEEDSKHPKLIVTIVGFGYKFLGGC